MSSPATPRTFAAALAAQLRHDATRPLVTFYDDATGERIELSVTTYANWVAKTAGLAQEELDAERGGLLLLDLPTHWLGAVWLGAAWTVGLAVTDDPSAASRADLVVCGPDGVAAYAEHATRVPVVGSSLRPLGGRFTEPLPSGVVDYGAVVLAQPDVFVPSDPPDGGDVAWREETRTATQAELLAEAVDAGVVEQGGRLITDVNPGTRRGAVTLLAPLVAGGAVVLVRNPDGETWSGRCEQERATAELRAT